MEPGDDINWLAQVRRGVAEQCVLALLTRREMYGFELARRARGAGADHRQRRDALPAACPPATQRLRRDVVAGVNRRPAAPLLPPHEGRRNSSRQLQETVAGFSRSGRRDPRRREPGVTSRQSASEADKLVQRYLAQLDRALQGVDTTRREEILAEVREHIEEGRIGLDPDDAASVRTLLNRVGDPAAIAAEAGAPPPDSRRWDAWAPWLIIFGPVASGLGWIAGMLILWTSPAWSRRDQLIATFVPLAGLVALFFGLVAALPRFRWLYGARCCPARVGWLREKRDHPPARSRHTAGRSRSRRSPAAADPPDEDASSATLPLCLSTGRVLLRPARST